MELHPELQLSGVRIGYKVATGSAVWSADVKLVTRGSSGHGSCLSLGELDCLLVPCSVG